VVKAAVEEPIHGRDLSGDWVGHRRPPFYSHRDVKDAERDGVRPGCAGKRVAAPAGKPFLHLGNGLGELCPDVVAEAPVTLPRAFTIAVPPRWSEV